MNSAAYQNSMGRFTNAKPMRGDQIFPKTMYGQRVSTQAFTFTSESSEMCLKILHPIRNVVEMELTHLHVTNPYIAITNINCCLSYSVITNAAGAAPLPAFAPNAATDFFVIIENGDFDPRELVVKLNAALYEMHGHHDFVFSYDAEDTKKLTLTNNHANQTFYLPSKARIDSMLAQSPLKNAIGSLWGTLGFAIDDEDLELRGADTRANGDGMNATPATPLTNMTNLSHISFLLPNDVTGNTFSSLTASFPPGSPSDLSGKSELLFEQFALFNNPFSSAKSKRNLYLTCENLDTSHDIVSATGTRQDVRRTIQGEETKTSAYAPTESAVNLMGVLAVIPVSSGASELISYSSKKIELSENPIPNFKTLRMKIVSEENEPVDMRGRSVTGTLTVTCRV